MPGAAPSFILSAIPIFFYKFNEKEQQEAVEEIKRRKEAKEAEMAAGADGGSLAVETAGVAADGVSVEITAADGAPDDPPDTQ